MVYYPQYVNVGTDAVGSLGDGTTINVKWFKAEPTDGYDGYKIAYHIYYSTNKSRVFYDGVKYISIDDSLEANLIDLSPGQEYFIAIRPVEYHSSIDLTTLPVAYDNLRVYPTSILRSNITATDLTIPLMDVTGFPATGTIKIGVELIAYSSITSVSNNLNLTNINQRGLPNTETRPHNVDGYDGYFTWDPMVTFFVLSESMVFDRIYACQPRFEYPNYAYTQTDGYRQVTKDLLSTDLTAAEASNLTFPVYDYAGYHRTDPVALLNGTCVGSYIGGEQGCIDQYGNVQFIRGMSLQDQNNQRQELELTVTGRPAALIKRSRTGIICSCYKATGEYPDDRCPKCFGTKFVFGYEQFFYPRRSDGRIMVRVGPAEETTKMYEAGLESEFPIDVWTLASPIIKQRDVIVLFDEDNNEEFRYEVMSVTRNNTIVGLMGGQKFRAVRIRKTDPAYQVRIFRDTSMFPSKLNTGIGFAASIPPHTHEIVVNEKVLAVSQLNQTTAVNQGHNHPIVNGVVMEVLGHTHKIII
jgi:hypothetical protein